ncbi:MAG: hypothetical protein Q9174_005137 [Haloplaca sp. 1 TL-2023]
MGSNQAAAFDINTTGDEVVSTFKNEAKGKTFIITGPSQGGIGAKTATFLAAGQPKTIILAGRTESKVQPVIDEIKKDNPSVEAVFVKLDLSDLASVRKAAENVNSMVDEVDVLINNAGVMAIKNYTTTADGIEMQFGSNHVGHFLFTNLIMDKILAAGKGARIVNVSSFGYQSGGVHYDDHNFNNGKDYNPWYAYAQSKTSNILFTTGLAERLNDKGILSLVLNPGLILESQLMTDVDQDMFAEGHAIATKALDGAPMPDITPKPLVAGCSTQLAAALDPRFAAHQGAFLNDCQVYKEPLRPHAVGKDKADKLWALSEKLVGQNFSY